MSAFMIVVFMLERIPLLRVDSDPDLPTALVPLTYPVGRNKCSCYRRHKHIVVLLHMPRHGFHGKVQVAASSPPAWDHDSPCIRALAFPTAFLSMYIEVYLGLAGSDRVISSATEGASVIVEFAEDAATFLTCNVKAGMLVMEMGIQLGFVGEPMLQVTSALAVFRSMVLAVLMKPWDGLNSMDPTAGEGANKYRGKSISCISPGCNGRSREQGTCPYVRHTCWGLAQGAVAEPCSCLSARDGGGVLP
ncbi:hypothetical protein BBP40_004201 [Aspergillus hancockii]|nr:hypothetical protein BBP40_004201 [Aspergillus hancockii]